MNYTEDDESIKIAISVLNGGTKLEYWKEKDKIKSAMKKLSFQYTKEDLKSLHTMNQFGAKWVADFVRGGLGKLK